MMIKSWMTGLCGLTMVSAVGIAGACGIYGSPVAPSEFAEMNPGELRERAEALRLAGPRALHETVLRHKPWIDKMYGVNHGVFLRITAPVPPAEAKEFAAFRKVIDQAAQQKDAALSGLYWYTDQRAAREVAQEQGKPIIYLRLLGNLYDERSCANSRFFRTVLYTDPAIAKRLREDFILCWESERPVPELTISFGDGRKLEQTITGNSAHYAWLPDGQVMDVLPGLFKPEAFHRWLEQMTELARRCGTDADRGETLRAYHQAELKRSREDWAALLTRMEAHSGTQAGHPSTFFSRLVGAGPKPEDLVEMTSFWRSAAKMEPVPVLSKQALAVIRAQQGRPDAKNAMLFAVSKMRVEDPVMRKIRTFRDSVAVDTLYNTHLIYRRVHERLSTGHISESQAVLNQWVYAELFKTPANDPWLGLAPASVYTGLTADGKTFVQQRK